MPERIDLEVPAQLSALSTVRLVLGGLGARLDLSLDDLDDLSLATEELLHAALEADDAQRVMVEFQLDGAELRIIAGLFTSQRLRVTLEEHDEACLDLCALLQHTVDEFHVEEGGGGYRVVLVKRRSPGE